MPKFYILDTEEVAGSNPVVPTISISNLRHFHRKTQPTLFRIIAPSWSAQSGERRSLGRPCFIPVFLRREVQRRLNPRMPQDVMSHVRLERSALDHNPCASGRCFLSGAAFQNCKDEVGARRDKT